MKRKVLRQRLKFLYPDYRKIIFSYVLFVVIFSLNDYIYWCYLKKCSEHLVYFFKPFMNIVNPLGILSIFGNFIKQQEWGSLFFHIFFLVVSYVFSSAFVEFKLSPRGKRRSRSR